VKHVPAVRSLFLPAIILLAVAVIAPSHLFAQSRTGTIRGTITDPSGAAIPGARVTVTNAATNVSQSSVTNEVGIFVVPFLPPGKYVIAAEKDGFKSLRRSGITLQVSDSLTIDLALELGGTAERVDVEATAPLVNASNASLGQVIENRRIVELPLNGREPFALAALSPGVLPPPAAGFVHLGGSVPSINGASNFTSEVTVDGMPNTTPRNSGRNNFLIYTPSVDAVAEFKVETNSLSAEFGRFNGGVISVVMKSGTNDWHGSVYHFHRNSAFDANSFFNNRAGLPLGALRRNQFGFTLGGPVRIPKLYNGRDRTFFFIDYEGFREAQLANSTFTVPTALERAGDFSQTRTSSGALITIYDPMTNRQVNGNWVRSPFPGNIIPADRISPVSRRLVDYYPLPTNNRLVGNLDVTSSRRNITDTGDIRIDHNISERNRLFGRYSIQYPFVGEPNFFGNIANPTNPPLTQRRHSFTLQDTITVSPTLIVNINYGILRMFGTRTAWSDGFDVTTIGMAENLRDGQQVRAIPVMSISGMSGLANGSQNYSTQLNHTLQGSVTKIAGSHTLKMGADFRAYFINQLQNTRAQGTFSYGTSFTQGPNPFQASATGGFGFATFLLGIPTGSIGIDPAIASRNLYQAYFVQDDWRVTRRLTLNLGLRYEINFPRVERYDRFSVLALSAPSPIANQVPGYSNLRGLMQFGASGSRHYTDTDLNNFAPRVGLAYQLRPTTTLRAGYGIFYGLAPTDASGPSGGFVDGFQVVTSVVASLDGITPIVTHANPFPNGINQPKSASELDAFSLLGQEVRSADIGQATPYFQNWNFSIQQSLGDSLLVEVAYAGNKGTRTAFGSINLNALTADQMALGAQNNELVDNPFFGVITDPTSALSRPQITRGQLLRPFPQYTNVFAIFPSIGSSIYHSFQMRVEKRFSKGFTVLGAFTAAKNINDTAQDAAGPGTGVQDPTNLRAERSLDAQDVSRRLVISGVWELPIGRGKRFGAGMPKALDLVIGGWQFNGIATFQTGLPLVMTSLGAPRPDQIKKAEQVDGPAQNRLNRWFDTSAYAVPAAFRYGNSSRTAPDLRMHGINNFDLSLFKNFQIVERVRAQLRFESFNAFNRVQFAAPGTQAGTVGFGVVTAQQNTPRQLQLALKLLF